MKHLFSTTAAIAIATMSAPAMAQDSAAAAAELAKMRADMAAMSARIEALEAQLEAEQAESDAAIAETRTLAAGAAEAAAEAKAAAADSGDGTRVAFKGAPEISTGDGWSFKPRGRLQYDAGFVNVPNETGRSEGWGSEARRARLGVQGEMPGGFGYKFEVDFAGDDIDVNDAIISYETGDLELNIGQHNNFQSLEELTSSLHISNLERAAFTDAFGFERRVGVSAQYKGDAVLVQGGFFTDNIGDLSNKNWSMDGRVVAMPKLGSTQLHFGGSAHYADLEAGSTVRYRQRPQVHFTGERFVSTGTLGADSETGFGLEAAAIAGRFHVAGEAYWQTLEGPALPSSPTFFGAYAEVGMFLTPDTRGYKGGKFDRVKPVNEVGNGGFGAVQVVLRYDYLDLNDGTVLGGQQNAYLASLVWTPTDNTRFMLNYGRIEFDDAAYVGPFGSTSYSGDVFGLRGQVDF
ncbi:MAG: porin [Sphingomonadaceae bacterium]|jgi:phosphate-selective porin OprO and OprP